MDVTKNQARYIKDASVVSKIRLGCSSKHETVTSRDPVSKELKSPDEGGVFSERHPTTTVKYPQEARFCFGLAMRTKSGGEQEGVKCAPFDYTGLTVLGPAEYEKRVKAEISRVKGLKCTGVSGIWRAGGYKERARARARARALDRRVACRQSSAEVAKVLRSSEHVINITELMTHVVSESKKV